MNTSNQAQETAATNSLTNLSLNNQYLLFFLILLFWQTANNSLSMMARLNQCILNCYCNSRNIKRR